MDVQVPIQTHVAISPPASNGQAVPTLLGIPREIRNMIYSYFVTVDQVFDGEREGNFESYGNMASTVSGLSVNRQIRAEVWDYLIKSNIWIEVDVAIGLPLESHFRHAASYYPYLRFPTDRAPTEILMALADEVAMRMFVSRNGEKESHWRLDCHNVPCRVWETYIFAYHPLTFGAFIDASSFFWNTMQLNPRTLHCGSRFSKLLTPLRTMRHMSRVTFIGVDVEGWPVLRALQEATIRPATGLGRIDELLAHKQHYRDQGHLAELRGRHSDAMCQYWLAITDTRVPRKYYDEATPEYNSLCSADTEMRIGFARSAHRYVCKLKAKAAPHEIDVPHLNWIVTLGLETSTDALERFVGLTDGQRREAHIYQAFHLLHQGNHLEASSQLFYAKEVDPLFNLVESLTDKRDKQAYHLIQDRPGPQGFKLTKIRLPLIGEWKGDPVLCRTWHRVHLFMMQLFRQRHNVGPDGEIGGTPENLALRYAVNGIRWYHDDDGDLTIIR
ncbi:hypothetical protein PG985_013182 [Apiospora marii]|uniref:Uncharacterized protein n=1 Tax=Apiospora marii TaxID=335849 RepID=A0ABR1R8P7_9PEZI